MKLKDKGGFPRRKLMENLKILKFFLCQIYNASLSDASNGWLAYRPEYRTPRYSTVLIVESLVENGVVC